MNIAYISYKLDNGEYYCWPCIAVYLFPIKEPVPIFETQLYLRLKPSELMSMILQLHINNLNYTL